MRESNDNAGNLLILLDNVDHNLEHPELLVVMVIVLVRLKVDGMDLLNT
ncbi:hypothetical protein HAN_1g113 (nucleomorph) [Hemiselmis andersenii]|uniref:Uncharacterized protein n=1 Tax=Hemiselmis andersenii TaxID=464988 RepID=A9BKC0_HEMAN|nr:hypothetical protein HAN_1g113 [Hemiselmis andersenii]ABW97953.1 hypothetical protein HAN_1g113 [Hemiselmis andersenii]